jgi:hypothetical protein
LINKQSLYDYEIIDNHKNQNVMVHLIKSKSNYKYNGDGNTKIFEIIKEQKIAKAMMNYLVDN